MTSQMSYSNHLESIKLICKINQLTDLSNQNTNLTWVKSVPIKRIMLFKEQGISFNASTIFLGEK